MCSMRDSLCIESAKNEWPQAGGIFPLQQILSKMSTVNEALRDTMEKPAPVDSSAIEKTEIEHIENLPDSKTAVRLGHNTVGDAIIEQKHVIPITGERIPTSKWEYIFFCVFVSLHILPS